MKRPAPPESVPELIDLWPSQTTLAADLGEEDATLVRMWKYRQRIPAEYDVRIVDAATARGLPISFETLARLRAGALA